MLNELILQYFPSILLIITGWENSDFIVDIEVIFVMIFQNFGFDIKNCNIILLYYFESLLQSNENWTFSIK